MILKDFDKIMINNLFSMGKSTKEYPEIEIRKGERVNKKFKINNPENFDKTLTLYSQDTRILKPKLNQMEI